MNERFELPGNFYGSHLFDNKELEEITQVLNAKSIFRYYGEKLLYKADMFERSLEKFFGINHCLAVSSGTASLKCALKSLDIGIGDEVIIPAYGFIATAGAIISCNAIPIFCDVDKSLNMDPNKIEACITSKTKAVITVHIMGQSADIKKIKSICQKHKVNLIEDVAQAFGAKFENKHLGTFGDIGCFSFQHNKILSTGEGGALITKDDNLIQKATIYHDQGGVRVNNKFPDWNNPLACFGENYRINEISAAIGIVQLSKMEEMITNLKRLKKRLLDNLKDYPISYRKSFDDNGECSTALCFFVNDNHKRSKLLVNLQEIHAHGYYNSTVYDNEVFKNISEKYNLLDVIDYSYDLNNFNCDNAVKLSKQAVWIPLNPLYTDTDIDYISDLLIKNIEYII